MCVSRETPCTSETSIPIPSMFAFPPPPIRSFKTISVQTDITPPALSAPPQSKTYSKKVPSPAAKTSPSDKTPLFSSLLGAPPRGFLGSCPPLSQQFHNFFGPNIPAKHMNKIKESEKTIKTELVFIFIHRCICRNNCYTSCYCRLVFGTALVINVSN